ncbi:MAG: translation initiation factor IF-2 N-terminal domain-containing protein, partial [Bacteroidota bacterium]
MPETAAKKIKVYKLATELNLSSETLIEFLHKKGFEVKSHMSTVTDEMLTTIMAHFKKEKDVAERHQRKLHEFRTARKKETPEKPEKKAPIEEIAPRAPAPTIGAPAEEVAVAPPPPEVGPPATPVIEQAPSEVPAAAEPEVIEPAEVTPTPAPVVAKQAPRKPKKLSPLEEALARPRMGLTIKGKIDIKRRPAVAPAAAVETDEDKKKKKKKKKKVREETKKGAGRVTAVEDEVELKSRKRKKIRHAEVNEQEVEKAIRETLAEMVDEGVSARAALRKRKKREREEEEQRMQEEREREKTRVRVTEFVTVGELANLMRASVAEVIQKCMSLGIMVSINQRLD